VNTVLSLFLLVFNIIFNQSELCIVIVLTCVDLVFKRSELCDIQMISEDENAERLAVKYGAHIVISSSSLQCLIDNNGPHFQRQWEIPVIVKDHVVSEGTCFLLILGILQLIV